VTYEPERDESMAGVPKPPLGFNMSGCSGGVASCMGCKTAFIVGSWQGSLFAAREFPKALPRNSILFDFDAFILLSRTGLYLGRYPAGSLNSNPLLTCVLGSLKGCRR
jgi:hypothetical protein